MTTKRQGYLPLFLVLLINVAAYALLFFHQEEKNTQLLFYGLLVCALIFISFIIIHLCRMGDNYLFLIVSLLFSIGMLMLFRLDFHTGVMQFYWFIISILIFFISFVIYRYVRIWDKLTVFYVLASWALFVATFLFGKSIKGAKNWIVIGDFMSVQPSEVVKILYIFTLAAFFTNEYKATSDRLLNRLYGAKGGRQLLLCGVTYINLGFLVLQKEWGLACLFFLIYFCLLYVYDTGKFFLFLNLIAATLGAVGGYFTMHHIQVRVSTWLNPFEDVAGKGYQITQSLFAIASGGFAGSGLGAGSPYFIPEVHSDFIFSAICEEMGILGGIAIIMLYFMLVYRGFKISLSVVNPFNKVIALGITIMFGFQTFIIIGGVIKFIPLTGITLPFISYGGSSLLTSFIALGILQAISSRKEDLSDDI